MQINLGAAKLKECSRGLLVLAVLDRLLRNASSLAVLVKKTRSDARGLDTQETHLGNSDFLGSINYAPEKVRSQSHPLLYPPRANEPFFDKRSSSMEDWMDSPDATKF
jgi:hypothetical protein